MLIVSITESDRPNRRAGDRAACPRPTSRRTAIARHKQHHRGAAPGADGDDVAPQARRPPARPARRRASGCSPAAGDPPGCGLRREWLQPCRARPGGPPPGAPARSGVGDRRAGGAFRQLLPREVVGELGRPSGRVSRRGHQRRHLACRQSWAVRAARCCQRWRGLGRGALTVPAVPWHSRSGLCGLSRWLGRAVLLASDSQCGLRRRLA